MAKRTALYETHLRLGGKIVDLQVLSYSIQYKKGIIEEHKRKKRRGIIR
jgi:glycine cleavage system aminomethyltransferase T